MQGRRMDRIGHLIQMELSELILHRVKDPRLGFVTVTHVDVAPDIRSACVYCSVMGSEEAKKTTFEVLDKAKGFLQKAIGHSLQLRFTPKLIFRFDDSIDRDMEIEKILQDIKKRDKPQEPSEPE